MAHINPAPPGTALAAEDVHACVRVLRAIEADRSHLTRLTKAAREFVRKPTAPGIFLYVASDRKISMIRSGSTGFVK